MKEIPVLCREKEFVRMKNVASISSILRHHILRFEHPFLLLKISLALSALECPSFGRHENTVTEDTHLAV